jgi:hypothetical protein
MSHPILDIMLSSILSIALAATDVAVIQAGNPRQQWSDPWRAKQPLNVPIGGSASGYQPGFA